MSLATSSTVASGVVVAKALHMTSLALIRFSFWRRAKLHPQMIQAFDVDQRDISGHDKNAKLRCRTMSRWLIGIGLVLVVVGLLWPWVGRLGLGRLPGDIVIERGNFRFYFPIVTCLVVSGVVSLILWFLNR